jgi:hypothetical protein
VTDADGAPEENLSELLRAALERVPELWPELASGECRIDVLYERGKVRRVYVHYGPIRLSELGSPFRPSTAQSG